MSKGDALATARRYTFLQDRDGSLLRWDRSMVSDVYWPGKRVWRRYQINPFKDSVTAIKPQRARELAGLGADLYADVDSVTTPAERRAD
jgi:hypothetical protein